MKKKLYTVAALSFSLLSLSGCLDIDPESDMTEQLMWKSEGTFDAMVTGVHKLLRDDCYNMMRLGEIRSDIYNPADACPIGATASKCVRFANNTLTEVDYGIGNYANFYKNINQINLFIARANTTSVLPEAKKNYYLGEMYGLRALYYFHLLRSWNNVVWSEEPSQGFEIGKLNRPVTEAAQIMTNIKKDIESSLTAFGSDYSFKSGKTYWSKAATQMLKAEVFLWSSRQMGGGAGDAQTALAALTDIQTNVPTLGLMDNFKDVFSYSNKGNKEIIMALHYSTSSDEDAMWNGDYRMNYAPMKGTLGKWYDITTGELYDTNVENYDGVGYYPLSDKLYLEVFDADDTRGTATVKPFFGKDEETGELYYQGVIPYKFQGLTKAGSSVRTYCDDYPIYRYADLLLMVAEAKSLSGGDPTNEINLIRERAFGESYDKDVHGYPNQAIDANINEALLHERFCEFVMEGKRWYDLRRFGNEYVFKYTTADSDNPKRLIWPIDKQTMVNNGDIHQTDGYETTMQ